MAVDPETRGLHGHLLRTESLRCALCGGYFRAAVIFPLIDNDPLPDTIPLTSSERSRLTELEQVISDGLETFLRTGQALAEIRNRRLYRETHVRFEDFVRERFGLHRAAVDGVIRSAQTAQTLLDAGIELAPDTSGLKADIGLTRRGRA